MNENYFGILFGFLKQSWEFLPIWIKVTFGFLVLITIIDIFLLKRIIHFFSVICKGVRDIYYIIKLKLVNKKEIKRIETLINWKKNSNDNKLNYESKKVIIKNVYNKEDEDSFIEASKKSLIAVIRKQIGINKSENLLNCTIPWVTIDYLYSVRKFLSPELAMALINKEIITKLCEFKDYGAESKFKSLMVESEKIKDLIAKIDELDLEGILKNLYIPYIRQLNKINISDTLIIQDETEKILVWLLDYNARLTTCSKFKYFPVTSFVYVKLPFKDNTVHIMRAINKFEKKGCKVIIISGWIEEIKDLEYISKFLQQKKGYYSKRIFYGFKIFPKKNQLHNRVSKIHTIDKKTYYELFEKIS